MANNILPRPPSSSSSSSASHLPLLPLPDSTDSPFLPSSHTHLYHTHHNLHLHHHHHHADHHNPHLQLPPHPHRRYAKQRFVADLSQCLFDFVVQLLPSHDEVKLKDEVRVLLEQLIRTIEPDSVLYAFGSSANGFSLRNSDMDLCCLTNSPERLNAADLVTMLGDLLERETKFHVKTLPHARIPIVKLSLDPPPGLPYGIACDIGFENRLAIENTRLLRAYAAIDPTRVRTLVLFLKVWSKRRKINSPYKGTLSSYGYVLLVLYFLIHVKNPPVLPNLQQMPSIYPVQKEQTILNGYNIWFFDDIKLLRERWQSENVETVAELLIDFFRYFSRDFSYNTGVASIRAGLLKKDSKGWQNDLSNGRYNDARERNRFCIEDPFETDFNVARCVTKDGLYTIRGEFMRASRILALRPEKAYLALSELCDERKEEDLVPAPSSSSSPLPSQTHLQRQSPMQSVLNGQGLAPVSHSLHQAVPGDSANRPVRMSHPTESEPLPTSEQEQQNRNDSNEEALSSEQVARSESETMENKNAEAESEESPAIGPEHKPTLRESWRSKPVEDADGLGSLSRLDPIAELQIQTVEDKVRHRERTGSEAGSEVFTDEERTCSCTCSCTSLYMCECGRSEMDVADMAGIKEAAKAEGSFVRSFGDGVNSKSWMNGNRNVIALGSIPGPIPGSTRRTSWERTETLPSPSSSASGMSPTARAWYPNMNINMFAVNGKSPNHPLNPKFFNVNPSANGHRGGLAKYNNTRLGPSSPTISVSSNASVSASASASPAHSSSLLPCSPGPILTYRVSSDSASSSPRLGSGLSGAADHARGSLSNQSHSLRSHSWLAQSMAIPPIHMNMNHGMNTFPSTQASVPVLNGISHVTPLPSSPPKSPSTSPSSRLPSQTYVHQLGQAHLQCVDHSNVFYQTGRTGIAGPVGTRSSPSLALNSPHLVYPASVNSNMNPNLNLSPNVSPRTTMANTNFIQQRQSQGQQGQLQQHSPTPSSVSALMAQYQMYAMSVNQHLQLQAHLQAMQMQDCHNQEMQVPNDILPHGTMPGLSSSRSNVNGNAKLNMISEKGEGENKSGNGEVLKGVEPGLNDADPDTPKPLIHPDLANGHGQSMSTEMMITVPASPLSPKHKDQTLVGDSQQPNGNTAASKVPSTSTPMGSPQAQNVNELKTLAGQALISSGSRQATMPSKTANLTWKESDTVSISSDSGSSSSQSGGTEYSTSLSRPPSPEVEVNEKVVIETSSTKELPVNAKESTSNKVNTDTNRTVAGEKIPDKGKGRRRGKGKETGARIAKADEKQNQKVKEAPTPAKQASTNATASNSRKSGVGDEKEKVVGSTTSAETKTASTSNGGGSGGGKKGKGQGQSGNRGNERRQWRPQGKGKGKGKGKAKGKKDSVNVNVNGSTSAYSNSENKAKMNGTGAATKAQNNGNNANTSVNQVSQSKPKAGEKSS